MKKFLLIGLLAFVAGGIWVPWKKERFDGSPVTDRMGYSFIWSPPEHIARRVIGHVDQEGFMDGKRVEEYWTSAGVVIDISRLLLQWAVIFVSLFTVIYIRPTTPEWESHN
jgi:hypothetical protein